MPEEIRIPPILRPLEPLPLPEPLFEGEEAPTSPTERLEGIVEPIEERKNELADLFEVPQEDDNDMYTDDLFEVEEEDVDMDDDLSDLTQVTEEDVMGRRPAPKVRPIRFRRTPKLYPPPSGSLGGIR